MSKVTNDSLTQSGTARVTWVQHGYSYRVGLGLGYLTLTQPYSCTHMATVGVKGLTDIQTLTLTLSDV